MRIVNRSIVLVAMVSAFLVACGSNQGPEKQASANGTSTENGKEATQASAAEKGSKETKEEQDGSNPALLEPSLAREQAPEQFRVKFETTKGDFLVEVHRDWSPRGADRFYNLVKIGFYNDVAFFRVLEGFVAQFGINGNPEVNKAWRNATITDDPVKHSNTRGTLVFATGGPNTRTTQLFINYADNTNLDRSGFSPFGEVVEGMEVVNSLYAGYGEGAPRGSGPNQALIQAAGNSYLKSRFQKLDYVKSASLQSP